MNARSKPQARFAAALVAAVLFAIGAGLQRTPAVPNSSPAASQSVAAVSSLSAAPISASSRPLVVLPQITIRPSAAERAQALAVPLADNSSPFVRLGDSKASGGSYTTSPRMNFDMPYYSFGKTLPRAASRE